MCGPGTAAHAWCTRPVDPADINMNKSRLALVLRLSFSIVPEGCFAKASCEGCVDVGTILDRNHSGLTHHQVLA